MSKRVNVLVYSGNGASTESIRHTLYTLRRLLSPNYAVILVNGETLIKEPWSATCALLVFPGGADLGYCRTLNGEGNRKIIQYVNRGGNFVGFCAGGYYGCQRCEWEVLDKEMGVVGDRELGFFPGICRGLAFPGFKYHSEVGTRPAELKVNRGALAGTSAEIPDTFRAYYNGGGVFVDAEKLQDRGVQVLASYTEKLHVDGGSAAVVYRKVGEGAAILTGPHIEFASVNLKHDNGPEYEKIIEALAKDDKARTQFLRACLEKLGLRVNKEEQPVPSLTPMHLSSYKASDVAELVSSWHEIITVENGEEYIKDQNDTFHIQKPSGWSMKAIKDAVASVVPDLSESKPAADEEKSASPDAEDDSLDPNKAIKHIIPHESSLPSPKETPHFNHHAYYAGLEHYQKEQRNGQGVFGKHLLYGEVITSTSTILEKNPTWLSRLPAGFTATATTQVAGRGRGSNVWVSPPGQLIFSTVLRHPLALSVTAPVIFVQYLCALAIAEGIRSYGPGYNQLPIKLKWPNDIYALDPAARPADRGTGREYVKIGGILVNSSYAGGDYTLVVGVGLNVANEAPTTCLNALARHHQGGGGGTLLQPFSVERLLARVLTRFEELYGTFCARGWPGPLEASYLAHWLHGGQIVTLEAEGGVRARITGLTPDFGLLRAEELGWEDRPTGRVWQLQSDANSFDFFRGLVRRKV